MVPTRRVLRNDTFLLVSVLLVTAFAPEAAAQPSFMAASQVTGAAPAPEAAAQSSSAHMVQGGAALAPEAPAQPSSPPLAQPGEALAPEAVISQIPLVQSWALGCSVDVPGTPSQAHPAAQACKPPASSRL